MVLSQPKWAVCSKYDVSQFLDPCLVPSAMLCLVNRESLSFSAADLFCTSLCVTTSITTIQKFLLLRNFLLHSSDACQSFVPPSTRTKLDKQHSTACHYRIPCFTQNFSNICALTLLPLLHPLPDRSIHFNRARWHRAFESSLGLSYGCLSPLMSRQKKGYMNLSHLTSSRPSCYYR